MISDNINSIREKISRACARAGRSSSEVTLLAVGKTFPSSAVREAVEAGVADVGENYVQELLSKRRDLSGSDVRWHFIGHLQSNKVKNVADWIHMIHAVDSTALAIEIDRRAAKSGRVIECLLEVNTTGESTKFGVAPGDVTALVKSLASCDNISLGGLMTIGPFLPDPEGSRPMFRRLRELKDEIGSLAQGNVTMRHLSMGMTGDFEIAIDEGATLVRIGTAIFGPRARADH
ncbi:MAG TPA: YggS family pyridoxal phosphate-dependent enzyme [Bacteroidota bacterium]